MTNTSKPDADAWIAWSGGEPPVRGPARVVVKFRDGTTSAQGFAGEWLWEHYGGAADIVAYKVLS
jgi:hypothetical protein